jgi:inhibitor of cysteine peptidase
MQYDERANGREVEAKVNEELEISLPETSTAGYKWVTKGGAEPVLRLREETSQANGAGVGGSGHHLWHYQAAQAGTGTIEFEYRRPWDKNAEPERTFVLKVRVRF